MRPALWYVAGRHSIAGPVNEFAAMATDPKTPIRFMLCVTDFVILRAEAVKESKRESEPMLSASMLVGARSRVVSLVIAFDFFIRFH